MRLSVPALKRIFYAFFFIGLTQQTVASELTIANVEITEHEQASSEPVRAQKPEVAPSSEQPSTEAPTLAVEPQSEALKVKGIKSTPIRAEQPTHYQLGGKELSNATKIAPAKQFQLHGYINNKYVYLVVEKLKTNDQQVVGYMFDKKGNKKYVYGEWVNNTLQIYEPSNKRSTVQLSENPNQLAK